jgi:hypothetical protein
LHSGWQARAAPGPGGRHSVGGRLETGLGVIASAMLRISHGLSPLARTLRLPGSLRAHSVPGARAGDWPRCLLPRPQPPSQADLESRSD